QTLPYIYTHTHTHTHFHTYTHTHTHLHTYTHTHTHTYIHTHTGFQFGLVDLKTQALYFACVSSVVPSVGMVTKPSNEQSQDFSIHNEDFPALPVPNYKDPTPTQDQCNVVRTA